MTRRIIRRLLIGTVAVLAAVWITQMALMKLFPGHMCALSESGVENVRGLLTSLNFYFGAYNTYPTSMSALGPLPSGQAQSAEHFGFISPELASGNRLGYVFRYFPKRNSRDEKLIEGFSLTADPITEGPKNHHYYVDDTGVIRAEKNRPASATSPETQDSSCSCAAKENYVGP